eukprot:1735024-Amphidinium_carterae.2
MVKIKVSNVNAVKVAVTERATSDRDLKTVLAQATETVAENRRNHTEEVPTSNTVTKEDEVKFKDDLLQGKREEIGACVKHEVFQRALKMDAINIMDGTWVLKWKWKPSTTRHYRARLCLRGFEDSQKAELDTFANTAARTTQRIICSCAA